MARRACVISLLALCLGLAMSACKSGPSSAGPDEAALAARKAGHIEGLLAQRPRASGVLAALITNLPDRVWLTDVTYDSGKVRTKGIAPSNMVLSDYISRLAQSPSLEGVALAGSVVKTLEGYQWVEFSLQAAARASGSGAARSRRAREVPRRQARQCRNAPGLPPPRRGGRSSDDGVYSCGRGPRGVHGRSARRDRALGRMRRRCRFSPRPGRAPGPLGRREALAQVRGGRRSALARPGLDLGESVLPPLSAYCAIRMTAIADGCPSSTVR